MSKAGTASNPCRPYKPLNLTLIGMPGSGKSTVGPLLAQALGLHFLDADTLMEARCGQSLQQILDAAGPDFLRALEEEVLLSLSLTDHVLATGGSAVYSERAMRHLCQHSYCIFLAASLASLEARISNFALRGVIRQQAQSLQELYAERQPLYNRYAELTIQCDDCGPEETVQQILAALPAPFDDSCWPATM